MHNRDAGEVASSRYPVSVLLTLGGMIRLWVLTVCLLWAPFALHYEESVEVF